jgi:hypothetical protein
VVFPVFVHEQKSGGLRRDAKVLVPANESEITPYADEIAALCGFLTFGQSGLGGMPPRLGSRTQCCPMASFQKVVRPPPSKNERLSQPTVEAAWSSQ